MPDSWTARDCWQRVDLFCGGNEDLRVIVGRDQDACRKYAVIVIQKLLKPLFIGSQPPPGLTAPSAPPAADPRKSEGQMIPVNY